MNSLSSIINYQLPQFIQEEHQIYVAFIQAYFEQLEDYGNLLNFLHTFKENLNIDKANDDFVESYFTEFADQFSYDLLIDKKTLIKNIKEFYLAKGSESSFNFIFSILFNSDVTIFYPRVYLQEASGGQYNAENIIYTTADNLKNLSIDNSNLSASIVGISSMSAGIIDTIDNVVYLGQNYYVIKLSSYDSYFYIGENVKLTINDTVIYETVKKSINSIDITNGGNNYFVDDNVVITGDGINALAQIKSTSKGGYSEYTINSGGSGYAIGDLVDASPLPNSTGHSFSAEVSAIDGSGAITGIRIFSEGFQYEGKTTAIITSTSGSGSNIELSGDIGSIESIEIIDSGIGYTSATVSVDSDNGSGFVGSVGFSSVYNKPRYYLNDDDWLSSSSKLQDSYYYQQFSYAIKSTISPDKWTDIIRTNIHPVGSEAFSIYVKEDEKDISISLPENYSQKIKNILIQSINTSLVEIEMFADDINIIQVIQNLLAASIGTTYYDIDKIKFFSSFDFTVGDLGEVTFDLFTFPNDKIYTITEKSEDAQITII